jgi:hypothetical protein
VGGEPNWLRPAWDPAPNNGFRTINSQSLLAFSAVVSNPKKTDTDVCVYIYVINVSVSILAQASKKFHFVASLAPDSSTITSCMPHVRSKKNAKCVSKTEKDAKGVASSLEKDSMCVASIEPDAKYAEDLSSFSPPDMNPVMDKFDELDTLLCALSFKNAKDFSMGSSCSSCIPDVQPMIPDLPLLEARVSPCDSRFSELPEGCEHVAQCLLRFQSCMYSLLSEARSECESLTETPHMIAGFFESCLLVEFMILEELALFSGPTVLTEFVYESEF